MLFFATLYYDIFHSRILFSVSAIHDSLKFLSHPVYNKGRAKY